MNKKGKIIYVRKDLVAHKELSELDFDLYDDFNVNHDNNDEFYSIDSIKNPKLRSGYYVDTTPLKISELEKLIIKFKKRGATHIQMTHHGDHHGYEFSAFNIELADDELINAFENERALKNKLQKEFDVEYKKLAEIKKKIDNLKV